MVNMKISVLGIAIFILGVCAGSCHADEITGQDQMDPVGRGLTDAAKKRELEERRADDAQTGADGNKSDGRDHLDLHVQKDDFTGDQYAPSDFVDTDFRRSHALKELQDAFERRRASDFVHREDTRQAFFSFRDQLKPVENRLLDWVPAPVDPLDNGGFVTAEDNGRPVPYRLNGHVPYERGYPWEKGD
jgi:hypothetical protein